MSTKNKVLAILIEKSPSSVSGEEIAQQLQISRTAIWKAIKELKKDQHEIISLPSKGYQYHPTDILSSEGIRFALDKHVPSLNLLILDEIDSTNKALKKAAIDNAPSHTVMAVNYQSETKGRFGRPYFAAKSGQGIYFSLLLHPKQNVAEVVQYTLITSVAIARAIEKLTTKKITIKWVNDLYLDDKKVCGILSEAITDFETQTIASVVIGIGINVSIPQVNFPEELQEKATSLFSDEVPTLSRNQLIGAILNEFYAIIADIPQSNYLADYRARSFVLGKKVTFNFQQKEQTGTATEISPTGELIVTLNDGSTLNLSSGEISLQGID